MTPERLVFVDQIAGHLCVTRDSIQRWIVREILPAQRVGTLWKFQVLEVDDMVRAGGAMKNNAAMAGRHRTKFEAWAECHQSTLMKVSG